MRLTPVTNMPDADKWKRISPLHAFLQEFADSGAKIARIDGYTHKNAACCAQSVNEAAKRYGYNVKAKQRGDEVFLVRVSPDER